MIQEVRAKELLEAKANEVYAGEVGQRARESYARLKVRSAARSVTAKSGTYEHTREYWMGRGELLEAKPEQYLLVMTGSGIKNQNPTVVELVFQGETLQLTAWAKEGLIPQKSASKAIQDCLDALKLA